jgi:lipid-binding SYLF domain-containing protein
MNFFSKKYVHNSAYALVFLAMSALLLACSTAPKSADNKSDLKRDANVSLSQAKSNHSGMDGILRNSAGYAVFPSVGKGGAIVGGAYGRGIVYQSGTQIGYTDLSQATIGLQLGGQNYTEILVFENTSALNKFTKGNFEFSSQATAVALKSGDSSNAKFQNGVAVFTMAESGLMFEASVGGQKFTYQAFASR